jgi:hydroxymethylpyrimidine/phosphomethylpyrimidine kinase
MSLSKPVRILAIAGSDSSGGAGIQADIKTITMLGGYAMTAITAVTAQNTLGVQAVELLSPSMVAAQIDACFSDIGVDAIKIGMLGSPEIAHAVIGPILQGPPIPIVFDPVMVATSGSTLADDRTIAAFERFLQHANVITPNLPELEALTGMPAQTDGEILAAASRLVEMTGAQVLAKGGHGPADEIVDLLIGPDGYPHGYAHPRIDTVHTHGTGCTLSSAIALFMAEKQGVEHSVMRAEQIVRAALHAPPGYGAGHGPMGHQAVR